MTTIQPGKSVSRETAVAYRGRPLVVTLSSGYLSIRPKGTRRVADISYDAVYEAALKLRFMRERAEQRAAKLAAKKASPRKWRSSR
jgi:hypothetical protein